MNSAKQIDRLLDTFEKRWTGISIVVLLFWLWQSVWLFMFFTQAMKASDYASLFQFLSKMDRYTASFVVRIVLTFISTNGSIFLTLQKLKWVEIGMIFLTLILFKSFHPRFRYFIVIVCATMMFSTYIGIQAGFHSDSLEQVISTISWISDIDLIGLVLLILILLYGLALKVYQWMMIWISNKNVQDL